jgi:hypothetical protein
MNAKKLHSTLKFGDRVAWYRNTNIDALKPCLANVHENNNGILVLSVLPNDSTKIEWKTGVRHVEDPELKERPRGANMVRENGCWEMLDEYEMRKALAEEEAARQRVVKREEDDRRAARIAEERQKAIAEKRETVLTA